MDWRSRVTQRESTLPRIAPAHLPEHIGQWYHPTVTAQWRDHVAPGRVVDSRTEARLVHFLFILFTRNTASTDIIARAGRVLELARSSRPKFNLVWHQFSTVQFPRHNFV